MGQGSPRQISTAYRNILGCPQPNAICLALPQKANTLCFSTPVPEHPKINNSPLKQWFPNASSDLFAAFMQRAIEWLRPDGSAGLLTMHNWMFLRQHQKLRVWLLQNAHLHFIEQHTHSDFEGLNGEVTQVLSLWTCGPSMKTQSLGVNPEGKRFSFTASDFSAPKTQPLFGGLNPRLTPTPQQTSWEIAPAHQGLLQETMPVLRYVWEVPLKEIGRHPTEDCNWLPYTKGLRVEHGLHRLKRSSIGKAKAGTKKPTVPSLEVEVATAAPTSTNTEKGGSPTPKSDIVSQQEILSPESLEMQGRPSFRPRSKSLSCCAYSTTPRLKKPSKH